MQKLTVDFLKPETRYWYPENENSGRLERYLASKQIPYIGDIELRSKNYTIKSDYDPKGDIRWGMMDMSKMDRAYRSYCVSKLDAESLGKVHTYEQTKKTRFLTRVEMEKIGGTTIPSATMSKEQIDQWFEFSDDNRPTYSKKFDGFYVPPYFIYDVEFDGMNYHHEWDIKVAAMPAPLIEIKGLMRPAGIFS